VENERNIFYDLADLYKLSLKARYFIGRILAHGRSLSTIVSPTVNSYRRLVSGYEALTLLVWGFGNRVTSTFFSRVGSRTTTMSGS